MKGLAKIQTESNRRDNKIQTDAKLLCYSSQKLTLRDNIHLLQKELRRVKQQLQRPKR